MTKTKRLKPSVNYSFESTNNRYDFTKIFKISVSFFENSNKTVKLYLKYSRFP